MIGRVQLGFAGTKMQFSNFPLEFYFHPYSCSKLVFYRSFALDIKDIIIKKSWSKFHTPSRRTRAALTLSRFKLAGNLSPTRGAFLKLKQNTQTCHRFHPPLLSISFYMQLVFQTSRLTRINVNQLVKKAADVSQYN